MVAILVSATLVSCNKDDQVSSAIYAPNKALVSESKADLAKTIANDIGVDRVTINSMDFLDVKEGYIAELHVATPNLSDKKVYYVSPDLVPKLNYDSSIEVNSNYDPAARRIGGASVTCSCFVDSPASSGCVPSLEVGPNDVTATCTDVDCTSSCSMSVVVVISP